MCVTKGDFSKIKIKTATAEAIYTLMISCYCIYSVKQRFSVFQRMNLKCCIHKKKYSQNCNKLI